MEHKSIMDSGDESTVPTGPVGPTGFTGLASPIPWWNGFRRGAEMLFGAIIGSPIERLFSLLGNHGLTNSFTGHGFRRVRVWGFGYRLPLTNDVPRKHPLNTMRRVGRRNLLRSNGLLHRWKYLPRYLPKNVATQRVAIDSLFVGGAS